MGIIEELKSGVKFISNDGTIAFMDEKRLNEYKLFYPSKANKIAESPVIFENPNKDAAYLCNFKTAISKLSNKQYGYRRM